MCAPAVAAAYWARWQIDAKRDLLDARASRTPWAPGRFSYPRVGANTNETSSGKSPVSRSILGMFWLVPVIEGSGGEGGESAPAHKPVALVRDIYIYIRDQDLLCQC